ncbi:MAG: hypothetical protein ACLTKI_09225 [Lachnospiraceae bacterium]
MAVERKYQTGAKANPRRALGLKQVVEKNGNKHSRKSNQGRRFTMVKRPSLPVVFRLLIHGFQLKAFAGFPSIASRSSFSVLGFPRAAS